MIIDWFQNTILLIILLLGFSGGYRQFAPNYFEIAQVDGFGWALLGSSLLNYYFNKRWYSNQLAQLFRTVVKTLQAPMVVYGLIAGFGFFYFYFQYVRFHSFNANAFDLGFVDQSVWSTANLGKFLHSSLSRGGSYLGEHFAPLLALLALLYKIVPSVYWLFAVQSALFSGALLLIYRLVLLEETLKKYAGLLVVSLMLYQPFRLALQFDFREDNFFLFLLILFFYLIKKNKIILSGLVYGLLFLVKENGAIIALLLSAFYYFEKGHKKTAKVSALLALVFFLLLNQKIMPHFAESASRTVVAGRLGVLGKSFSEIIQNLLGHPFKSINLIILNKISLKTLHYAYQVFFPFLFLLSQIRRNNRLYLAAALILFFLNVLVTPQTIGFHYECVLVPFLFLFLFESLKLQKNLQSAIYIFLVLELCVGGRSPVLYLTEHKISNQLECLNKMLVKIPPSLSLTAQSALQPHVDHREQAYSLSNVIPNSELVLFSPIENLSFYGADESKAQYLTLKVPGYNVLFNNKILTVLCQEVRCNALNELKQSLIQTDCNLGVN